MGGRLAGAGCLLLVLLGVVTPAGLASTGDTVATEAETPASASGPYGKPPVEGVDPPVTNSPRTVDRDSVFLQVNVLANGTARWHIEYRTRLDDPNTTAAFRSLQRDIRADPAAYSADFFERIRSTIESAENTTGRSMAGANFDVTTEVRQLPQTYGIVVYTFTWHGFAAVDDRRLVVGDVLSNFFLGENERLLIAWPDGYELTEVSPEPDRRREYAVVWTGPTDFGPNRPQLEIAAAPRLSVWWAIPATVVCLLAAVRFWRTRRQRDSERLVPTRATGLGAGDAEPEPEPELLSNEERVVQLLKERGGRLKQQDVVVELDWTDTKTSKVITSLREEGRIDSFRLGRENVLSLSDRDGTREQGG